MILGFLRDRNKASESASARNRPLSKLFRFAGPYLISIVIVFAALLLRWFLVPLVGELPLFITLYPAIMLAAIIGGLWPGIFAVLLAGIVAVYFLISPKGFFGALTIADAAALIIFSSMGVFISIIMELYHRAKYKVYDLEKVAAAEKKALVSQEDLRRAQAVAHIGSWRLDVRRNELLWSDETYRIFDISKGKQLTYETFLSAIHPGDREYVDMKWKAALAGQGYDIEHRIVVDGKIKWVREKAYIEFDKNNELLGGFGIAQDITDRKEAEDALRASEERLRVFVEYAPAPIAMFDRDMRYIAVSRRWLTDYNINGQRVEGRSHYEIFPEISERWKEIHRRCLGGAVERAEEDLFERADGSVQWVRWEIHPWYSAPDVVGGIIMFTEDITERKRAEEKLLSYKNQLENQTKELEQIIGVVSHDLRAPLVNIRGFNSFIKQDVANIKEMLLKVSVPDEVRELLDSVFEKSIPEATGFINCSAEAMNTLVQSLVEVARVGLAVIKPEVLDMNEIVRKIISTLEIKFKKTGAHIRFDNLPACRADKTQITQVFTNLIDNAVKYLDPARAGKIRIGGRVEKDQVIYCVADNGVGIEADDQIKIFEIFTRLASVSHAGGEGMGLTMVKRMVDRNNGKIWVESEKGKGSSFFISLPSPS